MKYAVLMALLCALCFAGDEAKPACNAKNRGKFWPEEANADRIAAQRLYAQGELEMCSQAVWKYRWQHLSIDVHALAQGQLPPTTAEKTAEDASSAQPAK
jgi:hypothetical protein